MLRLSLIIALLAGCLPFALYARQGVYNVYDYGAKGDGKTLDSPAINAAIEAAVRDGGGQVLLPAGTYLSGSIRLKSNIDLHLAAGCTILAAPSSMKAYDESESFGGFPEYQDGGHTYFHNSLIWAEGEKNVSITGHGMIDGEGLTRKDTEKAGIVQGGSIGTGDKAIALKLCRQVTIRDITIYRGGHFAIIMTGCDLSTVDNVTIDTNRDGFDIDCCKYMTVSNCRINTPSDDALVLKSSYALKKPVVTEHIAITNCNITGFKCGTMLDGTYVPEPVGWVCGRFKLGTESNGGYRNISLTNCTFMYSSGLAFEEVDQGRMENIVVSNITMSHVHHYPIYITTGCRNRGPKEVERASSARDIQITNVVADDCDSLCSIIVTGMADEPIRNVWLSNIRLQFKGGGTRDLVNKQYREQGTNYPEPKFAGWTPAYGLYARHVEGLHLRDISFSYERPDYRPAVVLDDVRNATFDHVDAQLEPGIDKVVNLRSGQAAQRSYNIVFIGNSITFGAQHERPELTAPPVQCAQWLSAQEGIDTVYIANCGRSGKTTYHFLPNADDVIPAGDKTYFPEVLEKTGELVKAHSGLPLVFSIMLGTNDTVERTRNKHTEPEAYAQNLCTLIDSLLKRWPDAHVVLNKPIWYWPDYVTKNGSVASKKSLKLLDTYYNMFAQVVSRCKPGHVHIGDSDAYKYFEQHYQTDLNEEKDSRGRSYWLHPNEQGAGRLAEYWGKALLPVMKAMPAAIALEGKKIGFIGDSYVRNHREPIENTWHYKFAKRHGMEYYNYGRNGNCIALDLRQWGTGMYKRYEDMRPDLDYVVVIAGHNDASGNRLDSIGIDTFKERLGVLCQGLIERYPHARLFFFTPWTCEDFEGSKRQVVVDAMLEVCGSFGIPVFDAARNSNIYAANEQFRKIYFQGGKGTDRAHLNARGHDRFLPVAERFIMQYLEE